MLIKIERGDKNNKTKQRSTLSIITLTLETAAQNGVPERQK
jgi:hypothetical protein